MPDSCFRYSPLPANFTYGACSSVFTPCHLWVHRGRSISRDAARGLHADGAMIDERREPFERIWRSQIGRRSQRWNIFAQECIIRPALECSHIKKCNLQINGSDDEKHHKVTLQCDVACCLGLVVLHSQNWLSDFCWPHAKKQVVLQAIMPRCYSWWENI